MPQRSKNTDRLGTDKIGKLLYKFSLPAIIGMVVNAIYNTVDRMYVGHGVDALGHCRYKYFNALNAGWHCPSNAHRRRGKFNIFNSAWRRPER
jgi:Na+-driven multidrug efflux pump